MKRTITIALLSFMVVQIMILLPGSSSSQEVKSIETKKVLQPTASPSATASSPVPTTGQNKDLPDSNTKVTITPNVSKCIISVDSISYDVTEFRKIHGGGDIFKCGQNMTADFYSQHNAFYLKQMEKYRI